MKDKKRIGQQRALALQKLYESGELLSVEFYKNMTSQIKYYLMLFLIRRGYYIDGVAQTNFTVEEINNCYTYVMRHIIGTYVTKNDKESFVKYDPSKGNIASFIRTWCQGYCSTILTTQKKLLKYSAHKILVLDDILVNYTPTNFIKEWYI